MMVNQPRTFKSIEQLNDAIEDGLFSIGTRVTLEDLTVSVFKSRGMVILADSHGNGVWARVTANHPILNVGDTRISVEGNYFPRSNDQDPDYIEILSGTY